jgi:predicted nucleic acid-binding protein
MPARDRFIEYGSRLSISTVTLGELNAWALRAQASPKRMQSLLDLLQEVQVLVLDEAAAGHFGAWPLCGPVAHGTFVAPSAAFGIADGVD